MRSSQGRSGFARNRAQLRFDRQCLAWRFWCRWVDWRNHTAAGDPEHAYHLRQVCRLILQRFRRRSRLFDQRRILLGDVVHLGDRVVHLFDTGTLLVAGSSDLGHDVSHAPHAADDFFHRHAGIVDQLAAGADLVDRIADQGLDFLGGAGAALCQVAHLGGDDCETAALFTGSRRFHRRVEREDIRLERDAIDDTDDVDDLFR